MTRFFPHPHLISTSLHIKARMFRPHCHLNIVILSRKVEFVLDFCLSMNSNITPNTNHSYSEHFENFRSNSVPSVPMSLDLNQEAYQWSPNYMQYSQNISRIPEDFSRTQSTTDIQGCINEEGQQNQNYFNASTNFYSASPLSQSYRRASNSPPKNLKRLKVVQPLKISESISKSCPSVESSRRHPYKSACSHNITRCHQCSKSLRVTYDPIMTLRKINPEDPLYDGNRRGRKTNNDDDKCDPDQKAKRDYARHYRISVSLINFLHKVQ